MPRETRRVRCREDRPRDNNYQWNHSKTVIYLGFLKDHLKSFESNCARFYKNVYENVSKDMLAKNKIKITPRQLENRFRVLKRTYLKTFLPVTKKPKRERVKIPFQYPDVMNEIFALQNEIRAKKKKKANKQDLHVDNTPGYSSDSHESSTVNIIVTKAEVHTPHCNQQNATENTSGHNEVNHQREQLQPRRKNTVKESLIDLDEIRIDESYQNEDNLDSIQPKINIISNLLIQNSTINDEQVSTDNNIFGISAADLDMEAALDFDRWLMMEEDALNDQRFLDDLLMELN